MAGDWIPMRIDLADDPAVIQVAAETGLDEFGVIGRLHRLWGWANRQLPSGDATGVTESWVDRFVCTPGFAAALIASGWLRVRSGHVIFPNFERWNSSGAKIRLIKSSQKRDQRNRAKTTNGGEDARESGDGDKMATKWRQNGDQRREEKSNTPHTPRGGACEEFERFWSAYPRKLDRKLAQEEFERQRISGSLLDTILADIARRRESAEWTRENGRYVTRPAKYLADRRWEESPVIDETDAQRQDRQRREKEKREKERRSS